MPERLAELGWLTGTLANLPSDDDWLGTRESEVLAALRFPKRRGDWRLGRWTAKNAVRAFLGSRSAGMDLRRIEVLAAPDGAPEAYVDGAAAPASLSLSHRAGLSLCVVTSPPVRPGCDVEKIEPRDPEFVSDYFTANESDFLESVAAEQKALYANLIWSAKESALKILRVGLRADTRTVEVRASPLSQPELWAPFAVRCLGAAREFRGWWRAVSGFVHAAVTDFETDPPTPLSGRSDRPRRGRFSGR